MAGTFTCFLLGRIYVCKHLQAMITVISSRGTNFIKVRVSNGCVFLIRCYISLREIQPINFSLALLEHHNAVLHTVTQAALLEATEQTRKYLT